MNFFVTATDTGAGKTFFCSLLPRFFAARGRVARVLKPVCCGGDEDLTCLESAYCNPPPREEFSFLSFSAPAAPSVAAAAEGTEIDVSSLLGWCKKKMGGGDAVFVEGVGGWMVPLRSKYCVADWACDLGAPVLLLVPDRLGCLNHTLLTASDIRQRGACLAGVILNELPGTPPNPTNPRVLADDFGLPVLGRIPAGAKELPPTIGEAILTAGGVR